MTQRSCWKKGAVLLQTVVIAVLLCIIAVSVIRLVLARYTVANRVQHSTLNTGNAQGYSAAKMQDANWTTGSPPDTSTVMDSKPVAFKKKAAGKYETTVTDPN
jgi:hypothetical protein